ncbi:PREDICTED: ribosomal RNA-processing protein 8-like [Amphimedon queenslandica]|uniref:Ribosomal RNA-processing protein 8 n=1 Tax=Amphimedon queenslandica TaxID=400682 RepID=A0A1X7VDH4_AMPQE|nr:PREDICTED: ribosomal RNA-processing protein 8-like [Amphimedon queenslandica]|eukprot:XP_003384920.1 PREDICTED: ribosomal RNA-processing protein 8-like [Amphimedon queenslandica]
MFTNVEWDVEDDEKLHISLFGKKKKKMKDKSIKVHDHSSIDPSLTKVKKFKLSKRLAGDKSIKAKKDKKSVDFQIVESPRKTKESKSSALADKVAKKMSGARFRWINEKLYTCTSTDAVKLFSEDPHLFTLYHQGFREQVHQWPLNPLENLIEYVRGLPPQTIIADFGCGEAKLAQSVPHTVHSFDFVAVNEYVTPCDMSNVPLDDSSVDVGVFCLSLMGTNLVDYFIEARRVLRLKGTLKVYEIQSRLSSIDSFVSQVESIGFKLTGKKCLNKLFIDLEFKLRKKSVPCSSCKDITLKPCLYKRR